MSAKVIEHLKIHNARRKGVLASSPYSYKNA